MSKNVASPPLELDESSGPTLTLEEAAEELRVSIRTIHVWVKAGHIQTVALGKRMKRIPRPEMERVKRFGIPA